MILQNIGEIIGGELAAMVSVEHLGASVPLYGFGQRLDTEGSVQGVGESPGQYLAAGPVHDGHEIGKALSHWQVGYVGTPGRGWQR